MDWLTIGLLTCPASTQRLPTSPATASLISTLILVAVEQPFGTPTAGVCNFFDDAIIAVLALQLSKYWIFE